MTINFMVIALVTSMIAVTATSTITTFTFPLRKNNQNRFQFLSSAFVVAGRGVGGYGSGGVSIDNNRPFRYITSPFPHRKHNNNIAGRIDGVTVSLASMDNDQPLEEEEEEDEADDNDDNDGDNGEKMLREEEENGESDSNGVRNVLTATAPKTITVSGILTELRAIQASSCYKM